MAVNVHMGRGMAGVKLAPVVMPTLEEGQTNVRAAGGHHHGTGNFHTRTQNKTV